MRHLQGAAEHPHQYHQGERQYVRRHDQQPVHGRAQNLAGIKLEQRVFHAHARRVVEWLRAELTEQPSSESRNDVKLSSSAPTSSFFAVAVASSFIRSA